MYLDNSVQCSKQKEEARDPVENFVVSEKLAMVVKFMVGWVEIRRLDLKGIQIKMLIAVV